MLVTGAGSYVGTSLATWLASASGHYSTDTLDMMNPSWKDHSFSGYDSVFHVAGIAHVTTDSSREALYMAVNRDLAVETAKKARDEGVRQFIFMSSVIVYGQDDPVGSARMIGTDTPVAPVDVYGRSKWEAEQGLRLLETDTFSVAVIRAPMIYGPGSKGNFPRLLHLASWCPVFPSVGTSRSMLFIDNLCEFVRILVDERASGLYFPQNRQPVDPAAVVREYRRQSGKRTWLVRGLTPLLRFASRHIGVLRKVLGNLTIDPSISTAPGGRAYQVVDFDTSIRRCKTTDARRGGEV